MVPLSHFQSVSDVFARCSHFPNSSGIWFLTSLHDGQWYSLRLFVPSSESLDTSLRPTTQCRAVFSAPSHHPHCGACLVHDSLGFSSPHSLCQLLTPVCVCVPMSSSGPSWLVSEASTSHPVGRPPSCPPLPALHVAKCATVAT